MESFRRKRQARKRKENDLRLLQVMPEGSKEREALLKRFTSAAHETTAENEEYGAKSYTGSDIGSNAQSVKSSWNDEQEETKNPPTITDFDDEITFSVRP